MSKRIRFLAEAALAFACVACPTLVLAQSGPFGSGTAQLPAQVMAILGPITPIAVMATGALSLAGRISWNWFFGAVAGTVLIFGAPQIVTWIRGIFGV